MPMKNPPHPGATVLHDCIEPLGLERRMVRVNRKWFTNQCEDDSSIAEEIFHAACLVERPS